MSSPRTHRLLPLAAAVLVAVVGCGRAKRGADDASARPVPSPRGTVVSQSAALVIGPDGGTLSSADLPATLTVTVPVGALEGFADVTLAEITSTAPGAIGAVAYRLAPSSLPFAEPVTLRFLVKDPALDLSALTVGFQDGSGYWVRYQDVARDPAARTLTVATTHLGDWAIVAGTSARDLRGTFTIAAAGGVAFTATGSAFLDYAAEDAQKIYYLLWGDLAIPAAPLAAGGDSCTPGATTSALPTNVAEVSKATGRFDWGASGHWDLSCTNAGGPAPAQLLTVAFDTVGVSLTDCTRAYAGAPVVGGDRISSGGAFTVTCGAASPPAQTATWDFANPSCGAPCTTQPDRRCHLGVVDCSGGGAACVNAAPVPDGTLCDDGDACTQTDACVAGACTGANPVVCTALDQCHDVGACDPATGACSSPAKVDGFPCSDGDACTQLDFCSGGVCTGANPVVCVALDQCHDAGVCSPATGACSTPARPDGAVCDDGNACTHADACVAGTCSGGSPVVCSALDPCHDVGVCDPATGVCSTPAKPDGSACSDGNACTRTDACVGGTCTGGNPVVCTALDACHAVGSCDPATGACSSPERPDGTACDDGNACTQTDTCVAGTCTGANPVPCSPVDACHLAACDAGTGACSSPAAPDGTPCAGGACLGGVCARTVSGPRMVTFWTDAGAQAPAVPADAALAAVPRATVIAYAPDGSGTAIPGTVDPLGGFSVPGVPVGPYLLVVTGGDGVARAVHTSADAVDLGWDVLGRPGATVAPAGTTVTIDVSGLDSWDTAPGAADQLQLTSADADLWDPAVQGTQLTTTAGTWIEDWASSGAGGPLTLLAPADLLWAHHLAKRTTAGVPAYDYRSATYVLSPSSIDMAAAPPFTLPLAFAAGSAVLQTGSIDVASWDLPGFEAWLSAMAPSPHPPTGSSLDPVHTLRVSAGIHALASPAPVPRNGWPDLLLLDVRVPVPPATSTAITTLGAMPYGRFLPARWLEWVGVELAETQGYLAPTATQPLVERVSMGNRVPQPVASPLSLSPALAPPTSIQIVAGAATVVSWTAPALGTPTRYTVDVYRLDASGAASVRTRVATLAAAPAAAGPQQLAIPPGVLASGGSYYLRVTAHADAPDAFATQPLRRGTTGSWASALTAAFAAP